MYEHMRHDIRVKLSQYYTLAESNKICSIIDSVAQNYDIAEKETSLIIYENETVPKIVTTYLISKQIEGLSELTIENYLGRLRCFFETVNKAPEEVETNDIRVFLVQYKVTNKITDRTLDKYRQILNSFFQWCVNEDYLAKNPCKNIKEIKYEAKPRHSLTRLQLEQVRRACVSKRDLAIVDVLYSTGCRVTELVNMKFKDIDVQNHSINIIGKGKKHNTVYLNDNAQLSLDDYIINERKGDSEYIFTTERLPHRQLGVRMVETMFARMGKDLGIKLSPHIIRHTTATLSLQSGMEITQVQKMLGHSSVATTQIYAETSQAEVAIAHKRYVV